MILKRKIHITCSNQCVNWKGNLKRASWQLLKIKRRIKSTKTEVPQIWKEYLKQPFITEFPHDENILQSIHNTTPGIEPLTEGLIKTKEEVRKAILSLRHNKAPGSNIITAKVSKAGGE